MYLSFIKNDLKKSKLTSVTVTLFLLISSLLLSTAAGLSVSLLSSVDAFFTKARTPHLMQMHKGELNTKRLISFVKKHPQIVAFQASEFLTLQNAEIVLSGQPLTHSVQDNGFTMQNEHFDFLLDLKGEIISASPGEVYVPVYYQENFSLSVGDEAVIRGKPFKIAGFVRDSQMNAGLASSKRFVVHPSDFKLLKDYGSMEYLISFFLSDPGEISTIEKAYMDAGLESNGPPLLTYPLFRLVNMITDGIVIALFLLIGLFFILMSILCLRFTIISKLNEDYASIGMLRGIGLSMRDIKRLYLHKYVVLAAFAAVFGFLLSLPLKAQFLKRIELTMGSADIGISANFFSFFICLPVFIFVSLYVRHGITAFKKISPATAIRYGTPTAKGSLSSSFSLLKYKLPPDLFLGLRELLSEKRTYFSMVSVLVIAVFLMVLPSRLYQTVAGKDFVRYLGLGTYDIRADLSLLPDIALISEKLKHEAEKDVEVGKSSLFLTKSFAVFDEGTDVKTLTVDLGDHTVFPLSYYEGAAPAGEEEIALSSMNAGALKKGLGDSLSLIVNGQPKTVRISGLYHDITNGGKTAKASFSSNDNDLRRAVLILSLKNPSSVEEKVAAYKNAYPEVKFSAVETYLSQTFGGTRQSLKQVSLVSFFASLGLCFILSLLFMRMTYIKDRSKIAALKGIGIRSASVRRTFLIRAFILSCLSLIIGIFLAFTLGNALGTGLLAFFGLNGIAVSGGGIPLFLFLSAAFILTVCTASLLSLKGINTLHISKFIKE